MFKSKEAANAWAAEWRKNNPEKVKAAQRKYYNANKEKRLANTRKWEVANPEKLLLNRRKRQPKIRQWKKDNPDKVRAQDKMQKYGITIEEYEQLILKQDNKCAICNKQETVIDKRTGKVLALSIDHDHKTDKFRELLCRRCNSGIGMFEESIQLLETAIQYLRRHNAAIPSRQ